MKTHYIIMSSSYSKGKRIAICYLFKEENYIELKKIIEDIISECGKDVSLSTHFIQTDSESWKSVIEKDYFFKDVELIKNKEEFIKLIKKDRTLKGIDVAKYILAKVKCTHLKLEKLVYLAYADYLCEHNKKLFDDKIYAFKYGPVVESVYDKYKNYGYKHIEKEEVDIDNTGIMEMPSRSRILFAEDGIEKINSIDETLKKYGGLSPERLVNLTHKEKTPWDMTERNEKKYVIIENETIKKYHIYES